MPFESARNDDGDRRGAHAGQRSDTVAQRAHDGRTASFGVAGERQMHARQLHIRRIESDIDVIQSPQRFGHEPSADEQYDGERHLGDNERVTHVRV